MTERKARNTPEQVAALSLASIPRPMRPPGFPMGREIRLSETVAFTGGMNQTTVFKRPGEGGDVLAVHIHPVNTLVGWRMCFMGIWLCLGEAETILNIARATEKAFWTLGGSGDEDEVDDD